MARSFFWNLSNTRFLPICAGMLVWGIFACDEEPAAAQPPDEDPRPPIIRVVPDFHFISNQYFWFNHPRYNDIEFLPDTDYDIDVFRSLAPYELPGRQTPFFRGQAYVDRHGDGADIDSAMARILDGRIRPEHVEMPFELLLEGRDYQLVGDLDQTTLIGIKIREAVPDHKALAVIYRNRLGQRIGGTFTDYGIPIDFDSDEQDTLVLELIKPPNPRPVDQFGWTWNYMMRFYYDLGLTNINPYLLSLTIEDVITPRSDPSTPAGSDVPYLRIFGLDRCDETCLPGHDNVVDYCKGTLDLTTGILRFPSLWPFVPDRFLVRIWTGGEFDFEGEYAAQYDSASALYTEYLTDPSKYHQYNIVVRARADTSTSFSSSHIFPSN